MKHLLVTNDFPPKVGGIQNMLWELWRRLDPSSFAVLTSPYEGADAWDARQKFRVERVREPVLLPHPLMVRRIERLARDFGAEHVVLDPALPLGLVGRSLSLPYSVMVHGAEITVPGRLPASRQALAHVLRGASHVIASGRYPAAEAARAAGRELRVVQIPPGVDTQRFRPLDDAQRRAARAKFGVSEHAPLVVGVSRLVPRKGFDVAIRAVAQVAAASRTVGGGRPDSSVDGVTMLIGGTGRDHDRLQRLIDELQAPVRLLGRVSEDDLPALYGCADAFMMLCRNRWGGLEQEGFGIVFAEAAACAVPQIAGDSGGAAEAVVDGETGMVVRDPRNVDAVAESLRSLLGDATRRNRMAMASRTRAVNEFDYSVLVARLTATLRAVN
ncbi:MAG: glycosyltransferase family 4 protein [Actinobacteria bacterium]|nr:glycosyltransferase family 4 protein [Actinomycetota bacterium]